MKSESYQGEWVLVPELSFYENGTPPTSVDGWGTSWARQYWCPSSSRSSKRFWTDGSNVQSAHESAPHKAVTIDNLSSRRESAHFAMRHLPDLLG